MICNDMALTLHAVANKATLSGIRALMEHQELPLRLSSYKVVRCRNMHAKKRRRRPCLSETKDLGCQAGLSQ